MVKHKKRREAEFIVTEHRGPEKLEELILEPLVKYINERAGSQIIKIREGNESSIFNENEKNNLFN